ncbi:MULTISPECIES: SDR family NAD(P)-dependent oxidoreductase [Pseudomonas]|uniref:SDR family NAD(P)-dependent oxidoreductase n=1 Tax=Pseudomonas cucumis TaxID=2954082 RepID=A0ABY9EUI3_9PSED|nr:MULTISPECIES: SDR family NAD(P)-dependent oxidoreductase [Pseudomonas]MDR8366399.1 SDR family NAD(P)-dependent oxidoreductase [Pseudomonas sp. JL3]URM29635.1 SDR family NAD(P)-dependent oxidoreductase [Pseudomonas frederiksbergensis]WLG84244.1 SDR family NAD(P)-dependent oxidoreductase [Pseudomonas cucumis]WLG89806.1 SDR family NAD(P)-dependent oxidoreductase [Pseudomonas cucumis]
MNTDETVVVTGVTSGIGLACARKLIEQGNKVVGIGRRTERLNALADELGERFYPLSCDVRDIDSLNIQLKQLPDAFAAFSKLINSAGLLQGQGTLLDVSDAQISTMLETNVHGLINVTRAVLPTLIESGCGHIINLTSIGAHYHYAGGHVYAASKAFVDHFGQCLRTELVGARVRLTNIAPGKTRSEFALVQFAGDQARADRVYSTLTPLEPMDVANSILWALHQPSHVNINLIELMPADQELSYR